jgi:ribonucleoside-diphosphate reductase alpha chain
MATGHAYDSEGGRAIAAAITSLMTGTAYRRSAELAAVVGLTTATSGTRPRTSG